MRWLMMLLCVVYWHQGSFRDAAHDIGPNVDGRPSNGNREFPWYRSGGFTGSDRYGNGRVIRDGVISVSIPEGGVIRVEMRDVIGVTGRDYRGRPVVSVVDRAPYWTFPAGTVFTEELYCQGKVFEKRQRVKGKDGLWHSSRFALLDPGEYGVGSRDMSIDSGHPMGGLKVEGTVTLVNHASWPDTLEWVDRTGDTPYLSLADGPFGPKGYNTLVVQDCNNCHRDTGKHVSMFGPFGRDWYGLIRGSDGIFSFEIHDPRYVVKDASRGTWRLNDIGYHFDGSRN